ncbi:MAG TPA: anti-sigma factor antagonist [Acidobacteria bacterium]|nr:anti-sigma factor antagonist [Acidobacteriota bacterium]
MLEHEQAGETTVVTLRTELDTSTAQRVKEELERLMGDGAVRIALDLSRLDYVDSAGLGALVSILKALRARGGDLRLFGLKDSVRMIFDLTRLSRVFKIFPGREEALASFGGAGTGG